MDMILIFKMKYLWLLKRYWIKWGIKFKVGKKVEILVKEYTVF